jgi:threonine dehydrogenase-like Zn-dependent dehydrogenase
LGSISRGLQTGFCEETSGGWSQELVAHPAQLFDIPDTFSDEDAVLLEPFACAVHAAMSIGNDLNTQVAVIGSGTLGLLTIAALRAIHPNAEIIATAKYPHQRELALELGATAVSAESELYRQARAIRSAQMLATDKPTDGFGIVFDAVGSSSTIEQALKVAAPGADVILIGMPKEQKVDLTPLWMKEISIRGSYAYGIENLEGERVSTFELAARFSQSIGLSKLLSATYRLDDYEMAIEHALNAGKRGSVKIAFDMRKGHNRESWNQQR